MWYGYYHCGHLCGLSHMPSRVGTTIKVVLVVLVLPLG